LFAGHPDIALGNQLAPRLLVFPKNFKLTYAFVGCAVSNIASVLWSSDSVYTFGENVGQLGVDSGDSQFVVQPQKVKMALGRRHERQDDQ